MTARAREVGTRCTTRDVDDVPAARGSRPDQLTEVRPQERVLRRTVEQNVDAVTFPTLDVPAHFPDPEQVIEVSKISLPSRPARRFPRMLQVAERVQVPLIDRWFIPLVQIVDIPALRGPFGTGGLRGFLPGQSSAASSEQTFHIPVPHGGRHGLHPPSAVDFSNLPDTAGQGVFWYKKSAKIPRTQ